MSFPSSRFRVVLTTLVAVAAFFLLGVGAAWPQGGVGGLPPPCANPPPVQQVNWWQVAGDPQRGAYTAGTIPPINTFTALPSCYTAATWCPLGNFFANVGL